MRYIDRTCEECGKTFSWDKYQGKGRFCSFKCRWGVNHRFWKGFEKSENGCWNWKLSKNIGGYGVINAFGEQTAHRVSWIIHNGKIPDGLCVLHKCDNPPCCNPAHLFLGTNQDNMTDKALKKRCNTPKGEKSGCSVLKTKEVLEIRRIHAANEMSQRAIAKKFGVGFKAINKIVLRQRWDHV